MNIGRIPVDSKGLSVLREQGLLTNQVGESRDYLLSYYDMCGWAAAVMARRRSWVATPTGEGLRSWLGTGRRRGGRALSISAREWTVHFGMANDSTRTVWAALVAGLGVALAKVGAAVVTSSLGLRRHRIRSPIRPRPVPTRRPGSQHTQARRTISLRIRQRPIFWAPLAAFRAFIAGAAPKTRPSKCRHPEAPAGGPGAFTRKGDPPRQCYPTSKRSS
jgi:hypothetical protein